jgi:hypothetical protein
MPWIRDEWSGSEFIWQANTQYSNIACIKANLLAPASTQPPYAIHLEGPRLLPRPATTVFTLSDIPSFASSCLTCFVKYSVTCLACICRTCTLDVVASRDQQYLPKMYTIALLLVPPSPLNISSAEVGAYNNVINERGRSRARSNHVLHSVSHFLSISSPSPSLITPSQILEPDINHSDQT